MNLLAIFYASPKSKMTVLAWSADTISTFFKNLLQRSTPTWYKCFWWGSDQT